MRTLNFLVIVIFFSGKSNAQPLTNDTPVKYVLRVSWKNEYHGQVSRYWLLEQTKNATLHDFEKLQLNDVQLQVTPLISPRYPQEYLFCCEKSNIEAVNSKNSQTLIDSLGKKYEQQYKENYSNETMKLKQKKALVINKDTLNRQFEISLFKLEAQFCKCIAAVSNPGSSYTSTIANIRKVVSYQRFTKTEKKQLKADIMKAFANKIIQEGVPSN